MTVADAAPASPASAGRRAAALWSGSLSSAHRRRRPRRPASSVSGSFRMSSAWRSTFRFGVDRYFAAPIIVASCRRAEDARVAGEAGRGARRRVAGRASGADRRAPRHCGRRGRAGPLHDAVAGRGGCAKAGRHHGLLNGAARVHPHDEGRHEGEGRLEGLARGTDRGVHGLETSRPGGGRCAITRRSRSSRTLRHRPGGGRRTPADVGDVASGSGPLPPMGIAPP